MFGMSTKLTNIAIFQIPIILKKNLMKMKSRFSKKFGMLMEN